MIFGLFVLDHHLVNLRLPMITVATTDMGRLNDLNV